MQTKSTAARARLRTLLPPILLAIGITVIAFAWLDHVNPAFMIAEDGIRDQLLVRDCTDLGRCHLIGPRTSVSEFHHGAAWLHLLTGIRLLGGDTSTARTVVLALLALSVGTLCVVMWHWVRPSVALPASAFLIAALGASRDPSQLVNGSVSAFPDILTAAGLLCYGLSGERRFLLFAAFALGVAINVHAGSLSLVPALVVIAALAGRRPWQASLAAVTVLIASWFITSRAALLANVLGLMRQGRLIPILASGFVVVLVSRSCGSRFRRLSWDARAWVIGVILILPFGLGLLWLVFWRQHHFDFRYLHPILGPAAALAAAILVLPFEIGGRRLAVVRWIPTAAAAVALAFLVLQIRPVPPTPVPLNRWTISEAGAIAEEVTRRGWSYEDLVFRLQGPACSELLAAISVWAPPPSPTPADGGWQMQVIKLRSQAVPALADPHDVVPLEGGTAAVLRQIDSWLRPERLRACRQPFATESTPLCAEAARPSRETRVAQQFLFITRSNPGIHSLDLPPPYIATYEIPLSPRAGETRELSLTGHATPDCGWHITRVEGLSVEGHLPARRVRLRSESGSPGSIVMEKPFGTVACPDDIDNRYPPCVFETAPDDPLAMFVEVG